MPAILRLASAFACGAALMLVAARAEAIPAFARKYEASCQRCHATVWPKLNAFGRQFKENGYQFPEGEEETWRAGQTQRIAGGAPLDLFRALPISLRGRLVGGVQSVPDSIPPRHDVGLLRPTRLDLLGGGSIYRDVSVFGGVTIAPSPFVRQLVVGVHNIGRPGLLNVRAGRFLLLDFQQPAERNVTALGNPAAETRVVGNPFVLDDHQIGVQAWGRPAWGPFFYELAVVQGVSDPSTGLDVDLWKDLWARATLDLFALRIGGFGYLGNAVLIAESGGITRRFQDPHSIAGVEAQLELPWLTVFGYFLRGVHSNPFAIGQLDGRYHGARIQADVPLGQRLLIIARYDGVYASMVPSLGRQLATAHLTFLLLQNLRASVELTHTFSGPGGTRGLLALDAAF